MAEKVRVRISKNNEGNYYWEYITKQDKTIAHSSRVFKEKAECVREVKELLENAKEAEIVDATGD